MLPVFLVVILKNSIVIIEYYYKDNDTVSLLNYFNV